MNVIVGLGNPGRRYRMTRHNIGFMVVDELAARSKVTMRRGVRICAESARAVVAGETVRLVKPLTYMNRSGQAVASWMRKEGAKPGKLIVIFDDAALARGQLRIRARGSDGGHNGVRSVVETIGSGDFVRIRVGIGPKPDKVPLADYVLGPFSVEERETLDETVRRAADAVERVCTEGVDAAMNHINRQSEQGEQRV